MAMLCAVAGTRQPSRTALLVAQALPAGPPRIGPRPVNSLSADEMADTSSGVMRWPLSAACFNSATDGRLFMVLVIGAFWHIEPHS